MHCVNACALNWQMKLEKKKKMINGTYACCEILHDFGVCCASRMVKHSFITLRTSYVYREILVSVNWGALNVVNAWLNFVVYIQITSERSVKST